MCKNTLPKDTNTEDQCLGGWSYDRKPGRSKQPQIGADPMIDNVSLCGFPDCDSCAQTLLNDLERLDDELSRIKTQLENASASTSSHIRLAELEKAIADTKVRPNQRSPQRASHNLGRTTHAPAHKHTSTDQTADIVFSYRHLLWYTYSCTHSVYHCTVYVSFSFYSLTHTAVMGVCAYSNIPGCS